MKCIEVGDDEEGQPRILIHATREELKQLNGGSLLYREVEVRLAEPKPEEIPLKL